MTVLQGALEPGAPLSRLHERQSAQQWPHTVRNASWMNVGPGGCGTVRVWHRTVRLVYGVLHGLVLPVWRGDEI
jgi:hypothetical protein